MKKILVLIISCVIIIGCKSYRILDKYGRDVSVSSTGFYGVEIICNANKITAERLTLSWEDFKEFCPGYEKNIETLKESVENRK